MTLSDLQGHLPTASLSGVIFRTSVQQLTRFRQTQHVVRYSVIVELLGKPKIDANSEGSASVLATWQSDNDL